MTAPPAIISFEITASQRPDPPPRSGAFLVVVLLIALGVYMLYSRTRDGSATADNEASHE